MHIPLAISIANQVYSLKMTEYAMTQLSVFITLINTEKTSYMQALFLISIPFAIKLFH